VAGDGATARQLELLEGEPSRADHHGNIATNKMISAEGAAVITDAFKNRWRTLMSVDDSHRRRH
jgi:hypothetical protein